LIETAAVSLPSCSYQKKLFKYGVQILNKNIQKLVWWFAKLAYLCAPNHKRG